MWHSWPLGLQSPSSGCSRNFFSKQESDESSEGEDKPFKMPSWFVFLSLFLSLWIIFALAKRHICDSVKQSCGILADSLFFLFCFSKVPPGTLAQLWQGCVCDIAALKQNYATLPSKCLLCVFSLCNFLSFFARRILFHCSSHHISVDLPLILPPFTECLWAVVIKLLCTSFFDSLLVVSPQLSSALMEGLVTPLQDRIEEWKKTANQLDKDHAKGKTLGNTPNHK